MFNLPSIAFEISISIIISFIIASVVFIGGTEITYAHFFGATKNVDNYQVIFAPSPSTPVVGDNSTSFNFSILENNTNIYNLYVAMVVSEKQSGKIIG